MYMKHLLGGVAKGAFTEAEAEARFNKWASEKQLRKQLLDGLMPFAIVAVAVAAFCIVGIIEKAL